MEVIPGIDAWPEDLAETVVTIGMFDGVHRGHRRIIEIAHQRARDLKLRCVVFYLRPPPPGDPEAGQTPALPVFQRSETPPPGGTRRRPGDDVPLRRGVRRHQRHRLLQRRPHGQAWSQGGGSRGKLSLRPGRRGRHPLHEGVGRGEGRGGDRRSLLREGKDVISSTSIRRLLEKGRWRRPTIAWAGPSRWRAS